MLKSFSSKWPFIIIWSHLSQRDSSPFLSTQRIYLTLNVLLAADVVGRTEIFSLCFKLLHISPLVESRTTSSMEVTVASP